MSLSASKTRLAASTKELALHWAYTKESWKDVKCREFERHYMAELIASVDKALTVIEQLDNTIAKVRRDCE